MEFSRQEYPAMLGALQPSEAVVVLNDRVKRVGKVNAEIADWLQERRRIEELYVQGLKKLSKKQPPDENSELGIFSIPWQKIVGSTESIAHSHHILAQKIEADVERPLRDFLAQNREMQAISTMQGNLGAIAKEIEVAQKKADKLKDKGARASAGKVANAASDVDSATSSWESQAPYVFEKLQSVDETRLNHLRDVLTQFQTHEVDQVERNRVTAEETLNVLLNVETADEIKTYALRTVDGRAREQRQRSRAPTATPVSPPTPAPPIDDGASERSGTSGNATRSGSVHEQRHTGFSGIKRLGTVLGRRRQSIAPYGRTASPDKRSGPNFGFGGRNNTSRDAPPPLPSPHQSTQNLPSPAAREERHMSRFPGLSLRHHEQNHQPQPPQQMHQPQPPREIHHSYQGPNGDSIEPAPAVTSPDVNGAGFHEPLRLQEPLVPQAPATEAPPEEHRDAEGFTIRPPAHDAISEAEHEAANDNIPPQFKLDIRNDPIQEEDADAETALANVANTLRLQAAPSRKQGTVRGRRDVRNTIFIPSPPAPESAGSAGVESPLPPSSPFKMGRAATLTSEEHATASDTQSIRSSRSLTSLTSAVIRHPEMHQPGLNSSIVEVVNASFEHGLVTKSTVMGEVALAYNPVDLSGNLGTEGLRLENFEVLEKVAPNPTIITPSVDKAGEYTVDLSHITRTSVGFKYQLHIDDTSLNTHCPITPTLSWKVEPTQTSVILNYSLNPSFGSAEQRSITLQNVVFVINLEGAPASHCLSKPVGTFSKGRSLIYWRLGDITLEKDAQPKRMLARFTTESEARPGHVEVRWEVAGENTTGIGSGLHLSQLSHSSDAHAGSSEGADPFADEGAAPSPSISWKEVPTVRKLHSGNYVAS
ncbi:MAG: hypothetical protein M1819_005365 [Sarea resinae]|nr:MAG: hypothetical protein M1819_005365 [Sarea resinae]